MPGTVGYALPEVRVRVADAKGHRLGAGDVGVLEVKGPNVFKGYWRNPEKTREEFRKDGYFITGDLATMDKDGRVTIVGRAKDLIITGGFNVYPKEIEGELNELPGVAESAVVGVPHPDFGEGVVAVVTALPGRRRRPRPRSSKLLAKRLAKFKLPKRVFLAEELPRNAMGKVQKAELCQAVRGPVQGLRRLSPPRAEVVQDDLAGVRGVAVLDEVDRLPGAEHHACPPTPARRGSSPSAST